jgi:endonuclease VIII
VSERCRLAPRSASPYADRVPEGDTIFRTARTLHQALAGREVVRFEAQRLRFRSFARGTTVAAVEARGKHCLIRFDDGRVLHSHMRMTGSWHLYRPGERWRKKPAAARAVVEVAGRPEVEDDRGWVAVCFAAPVVDLVEAGDAPVDHLGPDLCLPDPDLDEALRRLARHSPAERPIGDALLDQRVTAGIGNVYKSEACFACGIHPFTPVGRLSDGQRRHLLETSARMLRQNLDHADRTTVDGGGLAVYGRRDRPCLRCGTPIAWRPQGDQRRGTYWCPTCQPPGWPRPAGG